MASMNETSTQQYGVSRNTLRPVTIRQIMKTQFEENFSSSGSKYRFRIDGNEFESVTLVACVVAVEDTPLNPRATKRRYWLEDGTGRLTVYQWISTDEDYGPLQVEDVSTFLNKYIRVYGKPDRWDKFVSLKADHIRPIDDVHEIYFHILESMVATLRYSRGPPLAIYESSSAKGQMPDMSVSFSQTQNAPEVSEPSFSVPVISPPPSRSPSPESSTPADISVGLDETRSHSTTSDSSDTSSIYESFSDNSDDDELQILRHELDTPASPPMHTHHPFCLCPDKPDDSTASLEISSSESSAPATVASPSRTLRPDPYSHRSSLERNIILHILTCQDDVTINIASIGKAARNSNPNEASTRTVIEAVTHLLNDGVIETPDEIHFRIKHPERQYPVA